MARSNLGEYQVAIEDHNQAIYLDPNANNYYNRSVTYYELGNTHKVIADLTQALQINPNFVAAYYNRGNARYHLGDETGAFEDYNQARLIEPDNDIDANNKYGYYGRALARSRMGDNQGALDDLHKAATLCSKHRNTALYQRIQEAIRNLQG